MRHSALSLYERLKEKGLVDFSREKFYWFLYENGFGKRVEKGGKVYLEVEEEDVRKIEELLREWKEAYTPAQLREHLRIAGFEVSRATLYRYLRKVSPDAVLEIKGLGKRYKEKASLELFVMVKYGRGVFEKESVTRMPRFPEILDFVLKRSGAKEALLVVSAKMNLPFKERTVLVGLGKEKRVVVFIPSRTEGSGLRVALIEEPFISKMLSFKGRPTFTSIYLGVRKRNTAVLVDEQNPHASDEMEMVMSRVELFRMANPEGLKPIDFLFRFSKEKVKTEVFFFSDKDGRFIKVSEYDSLFVMLPPKVEGS